MLINDLSYLEVAKASVEGGRRSRVFGVDVKINKAIKIDIKKDVKTDVDLDDNLSDAQGLADAFSYFGGNTLAEVYVETYTTDFSSGAYGQSISAVD